MSLVIHDTLMGSGFPYIEDVEGYFLEVYLKDDDYTRRCLRYIEKAEFVNDTAFKDRLGKVLPKDFLSSGSKVALLLHYLKDRCVVNGIECGNNALTFILYSCSRGDVFFERDRFLFSDDSLDTGRVDVVVSGKKCTSTKEMISVFNERGYNDVWR